MSERSNRPAGARLGEEERRPCPGRHKRLSTRLVWVTMVAVMAAEVLLFAPSLAAFRRDWLRAKIETVAVASFAAGKAQITDGQALSVAGEAELLAALDAELIAVEGGGTSRLLARSAELSTVDREIDLATESLLTSVWRTVRLLMFGRDEIVRVLGPIGDGSMQAEVVISEAPLRSAILAYGREFLVVSFLIAAFVGLLLNIAINRYLLRPIRHITQSMVRFAQMPEDPDRIIRHSGRNDEIGLAEIELAHMQATLARTLKERRHLADLGLAVSKINHDLRNTLASAQLVSDRLSGIDDPQVQRFAPTLIRSLDRALSYTRSVLTYGRAVEDVPVKRRLRLYFLVEELLEATTRSDPRIELFNEVPQDLEINVDPDQIHRVLANLVRNAVDALETDGHDALVRRVAVSAGKDGAEVWIAVEDTGPGLSEQARQSLFQAFRGSTRAGGTGLGLAIAAEIVAAHGGRIREREDMDTGARFEVFLPAGEAAAR